MRRQWLRIHPRLYYPRSYPVLTIFPRRPRFRLQGLVNRGGTHLASQFGERESSADHLRYGWTEAASGIKFFAIIETENLLVNVTFQMKRFHSDVGSAKAALQQRPEILKAVGVYATLHIFLCVIHNVMNVEAGQFVV